MVEEGRGEGGALVQWVHVSVWEDGKVQGVNGGNGGTAV